MTVHLAIYLAVVSMLYAALSKAAPAAADAVLVGFVAMLLVPVVVQDARRLRRNRDES